MQNAKMKSILYLLRSWYFSYGNAWFHSARGG